MGLFWEVSSGYWKYILLIINIYEGVFLKVNFRFMF